MPEGAVVPEAGATVAVIATDWPAVMLLGVAASVVVVAIGCTGCVPPAVDHW